MFNDNDVSYMQEALHLATHAREQNEVPVGAVLVMNDKIIGKGYNQPIQLNDPTAHAEIIALRQASSHLKNYRLPNATLYVTLEPCSMCMGALIHARIARLVFATPDQKSGAAGTVLSLHNHSSLNHKVEIDSGLFQEESRKLLQDFFRERRRVRI